MDTLAALLSDVEVQGYLALWLMVFLGGVGVPVPTDPLLLAAGALAGHGDLNVFMLAVVAISASACGDSLGYLIGRTIGNTALDWLEHSRLGRRLIPSRTLRRSRTYFFRYSGWAIFLSRWLFSAFSAIVNLLAGIRRYPYISFLTFATVGEALDTCVMLALGIIFGASWSAANDVIKVLSILAVVVVSIVILTARLVSLLHHLRSDARHAEIR